MIRLRMDHTGSVCEQNVQCASGLANNRVCYVFQRLKGLL